MELTAVQRGEDGKGSWSFCCRDLGPVGLYSLPALEGTLAVHLLGGLRLGNTYSLHFGSGICLL